MPNIEMRSYHRGIMDGATAEHRHDALDSYLTLGRTLLKAPQMTPDKFAQEHMGPPDVAALVSRSSLCAAVGDHSGAKEILSAVCELATVEADRFGARSGLAPAVIEHNVIAKLLDMDAADSAGTCLRTIAAIATKQEHTARSILDYAADKGIYGVVQSEAPDLLPGHFHSLIASTDNGARQRAIALMKKHDVIAIADKAEADPLVIAELALTRDEDAPLNDKGLRLHFASASTKAGPVIGASFADPDGETVFVSRRGSIVRTGFDAANFRDMGVRLWLERNPEQGQKTSEALEIMKKSMPRDPG